jgi:hypothetical protein
MQRPVQLRTGLTPSLISDASFDGLLLRKMAVSRRLKAGPQFSDLPATYLPFKHAPLCARIRRIAGAEVSKLVASSLTLTFTHLIADHRCGMTVVNLVAGVANRASQAE